jgi:hypothetical protein
MALTDPKLINPLALKPDTGEVKKFQETLRRLTEQMCRLTVPMQQVGTAAAEAAKSVKVFGLAIVPDASVPENEMRLITAKDFGVEIDPWELQALVDEPEQPEPEADVKRVFRIDD